MNSISPLSITAHTIAIEHELSARRHDAAVHRALRGQVNALWNGLFGLARPTRRRRVPQPNARYSGAACAR